MHFILEGRIGIVVDIGEERTMRVRSLGRHTTIGEMGLITGRPRSATIVAEAESVLSSSPPRPTSASSTTSRRSARRCSVTSSR